MKMVKVKFEKEDLLEILLDIWEEFLSPVECDDCIEAEKSFYIEIYNDGALVRKIVFRDRFSYPEEREYITPLKAEIEIEEYGAEHVKGIVESIKINKSLAKRMIKFLETNNDNYVYLMLTEYSAYHYLYFYSTNSIKSVCRIRRPFF
jgi:hypothetical protein